AQIEAAAAVVGVPLELAELVADRGYHSNQTLMDLDAIGVRTYIAEPDRGRRAWTQVPEAQRPVYGNRRRIGGPPGRELLRRRGSTWSARSPTCTTPAACAGPICGGTRTS